MKVAILTNIPAPYRIPLWVKLSKGLDLTILYTSVNDSFKREWKVDFGHGYKYFAFSNPQKNECSEYKINFKLYRHLLKNRYDILVIGGYGNINNIVGCILQNVFRGKTVLLWDGGFNAGESIIKRTIKKMFYKYLTTAFCVSGVNAKDVLMDYVKDSKRFFNVHFTCDVEYYREKYIELINKKTQIKSKYGFEKFKKIILCSARLNKQKGIQDLLLAYKENEAEDIALIIAGTGSYQEDLKLIINENNIKNVFFAGFLDMPVMTEYYLMSDLFVLPTYYDPWGLVINEAMACGLPVISTTMAGASYDLIEDGKNGHVIEPGDVKDLSVKIKRIINDTTLQRKFSRKSIDIISKWTMDYSVKGFNKCFKYISNRLNNRF